MGPKKNNTTIWKALQPGEIPAVGEGHAKVTTLETAEALGLKPTSTAASIPICRDCLQSIGEAGATPASPIRPNPKNRFHD